MASTDPEASRQDGAASQDPQKTPPEELQRALGDAQALQQDRAKASASPAAVILAQDLQASYELPGGARLEVFEALSFEARSGEFLSIVGPSGCGKTTLLHLIAGLLEPSAGKLELPQTPRVAMVFQRPTLIPWRSVLQNASFGAQCAGLELEPKAARQLLERMRLGDRLEALPHQLSEGMKQRVNLARALLIEPDILLLDEPFSSLDVQTRRELQRDLLELWRSRSMTIIHVSHNLEDVAAMADRVLVLSSRPCRVLANHPIEVAQSKREGPQRWAIIEALEAAQNTERDPG
jgi:NitT/TauT family transport system ATP-binding protein